MLAGSLISGTTAHAEAGPCVPATAGGPMWVTADCGDPDYGKPVIDREQDLTSPVPMHKVTGHFEGTGKKFNFFPEAADDHRWSSGAYGWGGRLGRAKRRMIGRSTQWYSTAAMAVETIRLSSANPAQPIMPNCLPPMRVRVINTITGNWIR